MTLHLTSTSFEEGATIPTHYTGDGEDVSPPLRWSDPPEQTKSFALICDDPDAPRGTWVHWVIFNIPGGARELLASISAHKTFADGSRQGINDFHHVGYGGPAPPKGKPHRYYFKLYALDALLELPPGVSKDDLLAAMQGHVVAEAQLMGRYQS